MQRRSSSGSATLARHRQSRWGNHMTNGWSLSLLAVGAIGQPSAPEQPVTTFASAPSTCAVLQAAYTTAVNRTAPAYPPDIRASDRGLIKIGLIEPTYRTRLELTENEATDLSAQQDVYDDKTFKPSCRWSGQIGPNVDDEGHSAFVTFTSPVFSKDRHLALVEVSFGEEGIFGYGFLCTTRFLNHAWSARCLSSWIN